MKLLAMGDVHVAQMWPMPWQLLGKRLLGQVNHWINRRKRFDARRLAPLLKQLNTHEPDAIVHTGDFTTTASDHEFRTARKLFEALWNRQPTVVIPGNHDRYTFTAARMKRVERHLGKWMADEYPAATDLGENLRVIQLDAAIPTWYSAAGRLGEMQCDALAKMLESSADKVILMLCHYPLGTPSHVAPEGMTHRLTDQPRLREVLRQSQRPMLYLHGHMHQSWCYRPAELPNVVSLNLGACIMSDAEHPDGQGYVELDSPASPGEPWRIVRHIPHSRQQWQAVEIEWPV